MVIGIIPSLQSCRIYLIYKNDIIDVIIDFINDKFAL